MYLFYMANALEINVEHSAYVTDFLRQPFLFNYDTELPQIGKVIDVLQHIENQCKIYVKAFYKINQEYAENRISGRVLANKYNFIKSYNVLVIETIIKGFHTIIESVTINTNQQYKNIKQLNKELINRVNGFLQLINTDCNQCEQLLNSNDNLVIRYNELVSYILDIVGETYSNNTLKNSMETVTISEFEMPNRTPFRALEHLRNNLRWKKHKPEITELVDVLETFQKLFLNKFEVINNYIAQQLDSIEYIKSKPHVGGKTRGRRRKGKKTKRNN